MPTITIPKQVSDQTNLIAVPEHIYGEFLAWQKQKKLHKTFKPNAQDKRDLTAAQKNYAKGNYVTLDVLYNDLAARR